MADPLTVLATVATIIVLGFLGYVLFERTRVTDVLLLIGFGIVVGPLLGVFDVEGFQAATGFVGTLALIVIMFDGGLGLSLRDLVGGLARSAMLAIVGFLLTVAAVAAVAHYLLDLDWARAALFGTILGGTSGVIVMPIIARATVHASTRVLMALESALTDVLCVIGAFTVMGILTNSEGPLGASEMQGALQVVAAQFSVAIVIGLIVGFGWLRLLKWLEKRRYSYMLTLAAVLGLYVGTEVVGGNGAIAALIFGVVLGNGSLLAKKFDIEGLQFSDSQKQFQGEIVFLVRVFFFVYLGVILDPAILANRTFLLVGGAVVGAIVLARVASVLLATWRDKDARGDRDLITFLLPRGLAAVVLAGLPAQAGIPGTERFLAYAFIVVVVTNLIGTAAVLVHERRAARRANPTARAPPDVVAFARVR